MYKYYTLRIVVELMTPADSEIGQETMGVRSQELSGDLSELCMMAPAVLPMADGMAMAVLGAERRRHAEAEAAQDFPY